MSEIYKGSADSPSLRISRSAVFIVLALVVSLVAGCSGKGRVFDITDFGARSDGSLSSAAVQKAIDACNASGGGVVYVPPGEFIIGSVVLKSNVNLHWNARSL